MGFFLMLAISRPGITTYCWESGSGMIVSRVPGGVTMLDPHIPTSVFCHATSLELGAALHPIIPSAAILAPSPSSLGSITTAELFLLAMRNSLHLPPLD